MPTAVCRICGDRFSVSRRAGRDTHRRRSSRKSTYTVARFCTRACRQAAYRARLSRNKMEGGPKPFSAVTRPLQPLENTAEKTASKTTDHGSGWLSAFKPEYAPCQACGRVCQVHSGEALCNDRCREWIEAGNPPYDPNYASKENPRWYSLPMGPEVVDRVLTRRGRAAAPQNASARIAAGRGARS